MRRLITITAVVFIFVSISRMAASQPLELGIGLSPVYHQDSAIEAFSSERAASVRFATDIRLQVASLSGFKILPFLGYRYAMNTGSPYVVLDTELAMHDFMAGMRVRKGLFKWLGLFLEVHGGILLSQMTGSLYEEDGNPGTGNRSDYEDSGLTWSLGGLAGLEMYIPKTWMLSRGVKWFDFGLEISGGYLRRGDIDFAPTLKGETESAIDTKTLAWGDINLSGFMLQIGLFFKFF